LTETQKSSQYLILCNQPNTRILLEITLMRGFCLFITTAIVSVTTYAQNRKITAETTVQQVTIFSTGAQVHRIANVAVPVGKSEINFSELSSQLQQQSVQLKADANITLMSVTTTKDFFVQRKIEQDVKSLLEKKEELKEKSETGNKLMLVYKNEEQMLKYNSRKN